MKNLLKTFFVSTLVTTSSLSVIACDQTYLLKPDISNCEIPKFNKLALANQTYGALNQDQDIIMKVIKAITQQSKISNVKSDDFSLTNDQENTPGFQTPYMAVVFTVTAQNHKFRGKFNFKVTLFSKDDSDVQRIKEKLEKGVEGRDLISHKDTYAAAVEKFQEQARMINKKADIKLSDPDESTKSLGFPESKIGIIIKINNSETKAQAKLIDVGNYDQWLVDKVKNLLISGVDGSTFNTSLTYKLALPLLEKIVQESVNEATVNLTLSNQNQAETNLHKDDNTINITVSFNSVTIAVDAKILNVPESNSWLIKHWWELLIAGTVVVAWVIDKIYHWIIEHLAKDLNTIITNTNLGTFSQQNKPNEQEIKGKLVALNPDLDIEKVDITNITDTSAVVKSNDVTVYKGSVSLTYQVDKSVNLKDVINTTYLGVISPSGTPSIQQIKDKLVDLNPDLDIEKVDITNITDTSAVVKSSDGTVYKDDAVNITYTNKLLDICDTIVRKLSHFRAFNLDNKNHYTEAIFWLNLYFKHLLHYNNLSIELVSVPGEFLTADTCDFEVKVEVKDDNNHSVTKNTDANLYDIQTSDASVEKAQEYVNKAITRLAKINWHTRVKRGSTIGDLRKAVEYEANAVHVQMAVWSKYDESEVLPNHYAGFNFWITIRNQSQDVLQLFVVPW